MSFEDNVDVTTLSLEELKEVVRLLLQQLKYKVMKESNPGYGYTEQKKRTIQATTFYINDTDD